MIRSNCHTHTNYCDGKNTAKEMVEAAIEKGFVSLGFSGHAPMDFNNDWAMTAEKLTAYIEELNGLKLEYKDKIDILCGLELDADLSVDDLSVFDYTIGSVHQFRRGVKDFPIDLSAESLENTVKNEFNGNWIEMCTAYFSRLTDFVCDVKPDVVGHFDLVTKYNHNNRYFDETDNCYRKAAIDAIDKIISKGCNPIFEVNTGAMYRVGKTEPYPAPFIMEHLKKNGARITITSDSHCTDSIDFAFEQAEEYCRSFGFTKKYIFTASGIKEIDL